MPSRRTFLKVAASAALIPIANINVPLALAVEKVKTTDATAIALKYVEDATKSTNRTDKDGVKAADQFCHNCQYFTPDSADAGWGKCALFQEKLVDHDGWCVGWTKKAS